MTLTSDTTDTAGASPAAELAAGEGRVQLALNVSDVDAAVAFYSRLFGVAPAKRRPGYANFAIAAPPLKLVLIEDASARTSGVGGALNHLGVEVGAAADVDAAGSRLAAAGLDTLDQRATTCCYAEQDKVWVHDPDGTPWEVYTVLGDAEVFSPEKVVADGSSCCTPATNSTAGQAETTSHGVPLASSRAQLPVAGCC